MASGTLGTLGTAGEEYLSAGAEYLSAGTGYLAAGKGKVGCQQEQQGKVVCGWILGFADACPG